MPDGLFTHDLAKKKSINVVNVLWLQRQYRASTIVILGRIAELHRGSNDDRAVLRVNSETMTIEAAFIPQRLLPLVPHPKMYETTISNWSRHLFGGSFWDTPGAVMDVLFRGMQARFTRVEYSKSTFYVEVATDPS